MFIGAETGHRVGFTDSDAGEDFGDGFGLAAHTQGAGCNDGQVFGDVAQSQERLIGGRRLGNLLLGGRCILGDGHFADGYGKGGADRFAVLQNWHIGAGELEDIKDAAVGMEHGIERFGGGIDIDSHSQVGRGPGLQVRLSDNRSERSGVIGVDDDPAFHWDNSFRDRDLSSDNILRMDCDARLQVSERRRIFFGCFLAGGFGSFLVGLSCGGHRIFGRTGGLLAFGHCKCAGVAIQGYIFSPDPADGAYIGHLYFQPAAVLGSGDHWNDIVLEQTGNNGSLRIGFLAHSQRIDSYRCFQGHHFRFGRLCDFFFSRGRGGGQNHRNVSLEGIAAANQQGQNQECPKHRDAKAIRHNSSHADKGLPPAVVGGGPGAKLGTGAFSTAEE